MKTKAISSLLSLFMLLTLAMNVFGQGQTKSDVCHLNDNGNYIPINIADPAIDSHIAHGDLIVGDTVDENCEPLISTCEVTDTRGITKTYEVPKAGFSTGSTYTSIDSTYNISYLRGAWQQGEVCEFICSIGSPVATTTCDLPEFP